MAFNPNKPRPHEIGLPFQEGDFIWKKPDENGRFSMFFTRYQVKTVDSFKYYIVDDTPFGKIRDDRWWGVDDAHSKFFLKYRLPHKKTRGLVKFLCHWMLRTCSECKENLKIEEQAMAAAMAEVGR